MKTFTTILGFFLAMPVFTGCMTTPNSTRDVSAYTAHMPKSILIMPPVNNSPDIRATYGYWATVAKPIAEAGYYVFPMTVVDTMFKENGISNGFDAQGVPAQKLREIFGADAALYLKINEYGSKYQLIQSVVTVDVEAKLVDLKTGQQLWEGKQKLQQSSDSGNSGVLGALVGALVNQISNHLSDNAYRLSNTVSEQLYTPRLSQQKGLLYGPRSPNFSQNSMTP